MVSRRGAHGEPPEGRSGTGSLSQSRLLLLASALLGFWTFAAQRLADQDLFGHLSFGRAALLAGHVLKQDPYSYLPTLPVWYNHEWLWETSAWWIYAHGGDVALLVVKALCGAVLFACLAGLALKRGVPPLFVAPLLALAALGLADHVYTRPLVFTYMAYPVCLLLLEHLETRRWALPALVTLFVVWANMHAAFVVGLGVTAIYGVRSKWAAIAAALGVVGACVNPYGVAYWPFVLHAVTMKRSYITEFRPIWAVPWQVFPWYKLMLLVVVVAVVVARQRDWRSVALLAVTAYLSVSSYRHMPLLLITGAAFAPELLMSAVRYRGRDLLAAALLALFAVGMLASDVPRRFGIAVPTSPAAGPDFFPFEAVRFLRANHLHGHIACFFDWGEFLIWELPDSQISFDGRLETVYPEETVQTNLAFDLGNPGWAELLDRYPTDIVMIPTEVYEPSAGHMVPNPTLLHLFERKDFTPAWHGDGTAVFVRQPPPYVTPPPADLAPLVPLTGPPTVQ